MVTVSLVTTIILRICLMRENHRRTYLSLEEYQREIGVKEPCDWVSLDLIFFIYNIVVLFFSAS
jgi:hypothetical protein